VELRGGVQHRPPPIGLHQRRDTVADLLVQRGELVLPASCAVLLVYVLVLI